MCANCGTSATTLWRKNRAHTQDLCNACGCYEMTNKVPRPRHLFLKDRAAAGTASVKPARQALPPPRATASASSDESSDASTAPVPRGGRCGPTGCPRLTAAV